MNIKDLYLSLPYDTSGSIAKNRFQYEKMYGLLKMYDLYEHYDNFTIVFDYVCDIELHTDDKLCFYQIKTKNDCRPITTSFLTKIDKNSLHSVIGKLYLIRCEENDFNDKIELNIVGNVPFSDEKSLCKINTTKFSEMSVETQKKITDALKVEMNLETINLDNLFFVYCSMDLENYDDAMLGKTLKFYNKIMGIDPKKPNVLFATIKSIIDDKASVEKGHLSYYEVLEKKGLSKKEIKKIFLYHKQSNELIEKCILELRRKFTNLKDSLRINQALKKIIDKDDLFYEKEKINIQDYIQQTYDEYPEDDEIYIKNIIENQMNHYPIEYSYIEKYTFVYYEIMKYMEEHYE